MFALTLAQWAGVGIFGFVLSIFVALVVGGIAAIGDRQVEASIRVSRELDQEWPWPERDFEDAA